ncbi:MAG: hypothetical protein JWQ71_1816, partial [Pedosphaera sp.]|nr:hypothetical protein [Pedosphaera sp.]
MKRLRLILIIVALLVVGWLVFRPARPKEPSYQGKRLTEWLEYLDQSSFGPRTYPSFSRRQSATTEEYKTAKRAIQSIGTNAIPTLLRIMADRDSPVAIQLEHWVHRLGWKRFNITDWHRKYMLAFSGITL